MTASWLGISGGFYKLFSQFDDIATVSTKATLSSALRRDDVQSLAKRWPKTFNRMFDQVYGRNYLSVRFLIASIATTYIITLLYFAIVATFILEDIPGTDIGSWAFLFLMVSAMALPADLFALTKSRFLLRRLDRSNTPLLIIVDLLSSIVISLLFYCGVFAILGGEPLDFASIFFNGLTWHSSESKIINIVTISTISTSLWLLVFYLTAILIRSTSRMLALGTKYFNLDEKPFTVLGQGSIVIVTAAFVVGGLVSLL